MSLFRKPFTKRRYNWIVPTFYVVMAILIMVFNDVLGEKDEFVVFSLLFFITMTIVFLRWILLQIRSIIKLKKEKKEAELLHLKSQVNPHFFFNTLNNLYGLVEQDTDKAKQLILKLSDMMRYSIYEGQKDFVSLGEEVDYLQNYIELHKMRYHKKIDVAFDIDIEDEQIKVMPLLFIILLENAFKHGVENLRKDAFVSLQLKATSDQIVFEVVNNFDKEELNGHQGIGLENLRRRLNLVYTNQHEFTTQLKDNLFEAKLSLQL